MNLDQDPILTYSETTLNFKTFIHKSTLSVFKMEQADGSNSFSFNFSSYGFSFKGLKLSQRAHIQQEFNGNVLPVGLADLMEHRLGAKATESLLKDLSQDDIALTCPKRDKRFGGWLYY